MFEDFYKWHNNFLTKFGEYNRQYLNKEYLKTVYDSNEESHKSFKKIPQDFNIKFDISKIPELTIKDISLQIDHILCYIPNYLKTYDLTRDVFMGSMVGKVKLNKHVLTYAGKLGLYTKDLVKNRLDSLSCKKADFTPRLANNTILNIKILHDLESFIKLGHYEVDHGSCFGFWSARYDNKYKLAMKKNSFVCLINNEAGSILARCWGFLSSNRIVFSNFYSKTLNKTDFRMIGQQIAELVFKRNDLKFFKQILNPINDVYCNRDDITFSTSKTKLQRIYIK